MSLKLYPWFISRLFLFSFSTLLAWGSSPLLFNSCQRESLYSGITSKFKVRKTQQGGVTRARKCLLSFLPLQYVHWPGQVTWLPRVNRGARVLSTWLFSLANWGQHGMVRLGMDAKWTNTKSLFALIWGNGNDLADSSHRSAKLVIRTGQALSRIGSWSHGNTQVTPAFGLARP